MAKRQVVAGSTDQTIDVFIQDSSSTTGAGLTGLLFNTASLTCYYRKGATGTPTALSLVTQTVGGGHQDGGFVAVDGTNCPGQYRLDLSDTIVNTAGISTLYLKGAANMVPCVVELEVITGDFTTTEKASINTEVLDVLSVDTFGEPSGTPGATLTLREKIGWLFMALRNRLDVNNSTTKKIFYDDAGNAEWSKTLSDDGTTYSEGEATTP